MQETGRGAMRSTREQMRAATTRFVAWVSEGNDVSAMLVFFAPLFVLGGVGVACAGVGNRSIAGMMALSCTACGAAVGFLFGIPRTLQDGSEPLRAEVAGAGPAAARQAVNTNLEQISDWLTKIIVGISLVQFRDVLAALQSVVAVFAQELRPHSSLAFAGGLVAYFSVLGFLWGYILTRLYLAGAFWRAQRAVAEVKAAAAERIEAIDHEARKLDRETRETLDRGLSLAMELISAVAVVDHGTEADRERTIRSLVGLEAHFPRHRRLGIMIGRLYKSTGDYARGVEALTRFIERKRSAGESDKDLADLLYNRACYEVLLASRVGSEEGAALHERACADLTESFRLSEVNRREARSEQDFESVRNAGWFVGMTQEA